MWLITSTFRIFSLQWYQPIACLNLDAHHSFDYWTLSVVERWLYLTTPFIKSIMQSFHHHGSDISFCIRSTPQWNRFNFTPMKYLFNFLGQAGQADYKSARAIPHSPFSIFNFQFSIFNFQLKNYPTIPSTNVSTKSTTLLSNLSPIDLRCNTDGCSPSIRSNRSSRNGSRSA